MMSAGRVHLLAEGDGRETLVPFLAKRRQEADALDHLAQPVALSQRTDLGGCPTHAQTGGVLVVAIDEDVVLQEEGERAPAAQSSLRRGEMVSGGSATSPSPALTAGHVES